MQRSLRLKNELPTLNNQTGFSCWSVDDSLEHLQASKSSIKLPMKRKWALQLACGRNSNLIGPPSSPYESGVFKLDIFIPARYPFEPPSVKFLTPIYHPNIDEAGRICHDVLKLPPKGAWKPSVNICAVLRNLQLLLIEPNPDDPLMADI
eukprot:Awhi_evm1s5253